MTGVLSNVMPLLAARSSDDDLMKILFGVGAVVVWGLFQLIAAAAKKAEEAKRRARYGRLPEDVATSSSGAGYGGYGGAGPMPPAPPPLPTAQWPQQQAKAKGKGKGRARAPKRTVGDGAAVAAASVAAVRAARGGTGTPGVPEANAADAAPTAGRAATAPANRVAQLLRRRESLRAALILNEVLAPPVGLRDDARPPGRA